MLNLRAEHDDDQVRSIVRRLGYLAGAVGGLVLLGTVATHIFEDTSLWESLLLTVDAVATVGAIEPPQTLGGEITRLTMIIFGVGTLFYGLVTAAEFFVAGHLTGFWQRRKDKKEIAFMTGHYIICGYGRVGRRAAAALIEAGEQIVVIDPGSEARLHAENEGVLIIPERAADEDALHDARIQQAQGLLACSDSDPENVYIVLSARELAPKIAIVARASSAFAESKMRKAGADYVISPYESSAKQMAEQVLAPHEALS